MTASIDTNILLRLIKADVPDQAEIAERLLCDQDNPVTVDIQALIEAVFALEHHYGLTREQCALMMTTTLELPTLVGDHAAFRAALTSWVSHPKLSLSDCYLAERAQATGCLPLWTFDRKLASQHPAARLALATDTMQE